MVQNYIDYAKEIISLTHVDYAGFQRQSLPNAGRYLKKIEKCATYKEFFYETEKFLLSFQDRHLAIKDHTQQIWENNFLVRRFENSLYVTACGKNSPLPIGSELVAIDGKSISQVSHSFQDLLDPIHERQDFRFILNYAQEVTVRNGSSYQLVKEVHPFSYNPEFIYKKISNTCSYLKLTDFADDSAIIELLEKNTTDLSSIPHLIIDVRINLGGSDINYFPLLPYLFTKNRSISQLVAPSDFLFFNVTQRSYDLRKELFTNEVIEQLPETFHPFLKKEQIFWEHHRGMGMVPRFNDFDYSFEGKSYPKKIVILTDVACGSSGDQFVETCKRSEKVTIIGRNTLGANDYANCVEQSYPEFTIMYPTSKHSRVDRGAGLLGKGVVPDIRIPFTRKHLVKDVDLAFALDYLTEK
ncbi:S41 family peptidase [Enterococcus sp. JM9B]|uniref:S41 family peptidase n=1 Tax=Enterococcus sp. JM9B TaxID=1857216 RepID=UPI0013753727|nr:S41 family peptidase [Enterococcus sp. JM9B]KAF1300851.1 hypothetical protein BAU16_10735 [Enterococcus sp. JM9B]